MRTIVLFLIFVALADISDKLADIATASRCPSTIVPLAQ